jgi:uncharacterized repeat protein (TIGR01451 family)
VEGATITCTQPALLATQATQITVTSTHSAGGDMEVNAAVQSSESDLETSNNSVRKVGVVDQVSDLSISASGPNTVNEGAGISYTLIVANSGPQDAEDVTATIQLGAGMSFAASSSTS